MPGCVLRVGGAFSAADLLSRFPLPRVTRADDGCVLALVSRDECPDWSAQVADAESFLSTFGDMLRQLMASFAVGVELDFGVSHAGEFVQSVQFPSTLTALTGSLGIVLRVSVYASDDS